MGRGNPRTWQKWCKKTYNTYCGMSNDWDDPESVLITVRDFYTTIHDCGNPNPSGYISYNALQNKLEKRKTVTDHCNSPQFVGRMIIENWELYKDDYPRFEKVFFDACLTILVTAEENTQLSLQTKNDKYGFRVEVPTDKKYEHLNITLFERVGSSRWSDAIPADIDEFPTTEGLLEYEKKYLVCL